MAGEWRQRKALYTGGSRLSPSPAYASPFWNLRKLDGHQFGGKESPNVHISNCWIEMRDQGGWRQPSALAFISHSWREFTISPTKWMNGRKPTGKSSKDPKRMPFYLLLSGISIALIIRTKYFPFNVQVRPTCNFMRSVWRTRVLLFLFLGPCGGSYNRSDHDTVTTQVDGMRGPQWQGTVGSPPT